MTNSQNKPEASRLETFQNEILPNAEATIQEWVSETSKFVKKHPVASVAGALVVGYLIGAAIAKIRTSKERDI